MAAYAWPGNVRELENFMERLSVLVDGDIVNLCDLPPKILEQVGDVVSVLDIDERQGTPESGISEQAPMADKESAPAAFVWPDLAVLEARGMNLKDFLDTVENRLIDEALDKAGGVKNLAAEFLGIKRTTLIEKLRKR
jgi:DNA-binding NtrC family response regulator